MPHINIKSIMSSQTLSNTTNMKNNIEKQIKTEYNKLCKNCAIKCTNEWKSIVYSNDFNFNIESGHDMNLLLEILKNSSCKH